MAAANASHPSAIGAHGSGGIASTADAVVLAAVGVASTIVHGSIFLLGRKAHRGPQDVFFATYMISLLHAILAGVLGSVGWVMMMTAPQAHLFAGCVDTTSEPFAGTLMVTPPPAPTVIATGISCGYFAVDLVNMAVFAKEWRTCLGGGMYLVMWMHHVVSLLVWTFSVLTHRSSFFVSWLLTTELSNIGNNLYELAKLRKYSDGAVTRIGLLWIVSFFLVRIVPAPYIAYAYGLLLRTGCGLSTFERVVSLITVPIPMMLNGWWAYLMIAGARKALRGDGKAQGEGTRAEGGSAGGAAKAATLDIAVEVGSTT